MCLHVHTFPQLAPPLERRQASNVCVAVRVAVCPSVAARGRTQAPIKDLALPKQRQPPFRGLATRHTEAGRKDGQNRRTREGSWDHEVLQRKGGRKGGGCGNGDLLQTGSVSTSVVAALDSDRGGARCRLAAEGPRLGLTPRLSIPSPNSPSHDSAGRLMGSSSFTPATSCVRRKQHCIPRSLTNPPHKRAVLQTTGAFAPVRAAPLSFASASHTILEVAFLQNSAGSA